MKDSIRSSRGIGSTLRLLLESTPIPRGFEDGGTPDDIDADYLVAAFERMRDAREAIIDAVQGSWDIEDPVDIALLSELNERDQIWRHALNEALAKMTAEEVASCANSDHDD
jgi:hypothetical protein